MIDIKFWGPIFVTRITLGNHLCKSSKTIVASWMTSSYEVRYLLHISLSLIIFVKAREQLLQFEYVKYWSLIFVTHITLNNHLCKSSRTIVATSKDQILLQCVVDDMLLRHTYSQCSFERYFLAQYHTDLKSFEANKTRLEWPKPGTTAEIRVRRSHKIHKWVSCTWCWWKHPLLHVAQTPLE